MRHGVRVVAAAADGLVVEVGGPGAGGSGVSGEVAQGVPELLVCSPPERDGLDLARLPGGGGDSGQAGQGVAGGEAPRASPISASSRAARMVPERGRDVKITASGACVPLDADSTRKSVIRLKSLSIVSTPFETLACGEAFDRGLL